MVRMLDLVEVAWYIGMSKTFGVRESGVESCLCPLSALQLWTGHFTSKIHGPLSQCLKDCRNDICKVPHCAWHIVSTQETLVKSIVEPAAT